MQKIDTYCNDELENFNFSKVRKRLRSCFNSLSISQQEAGLTINPNRPELKFKVVGTLDDNARGDLNDEMADLCAKIPIHVVVKIDRAPTDQPTDNAPVKVVKRELNSWNIVHDVRTLFLLSVQVKVDFGQSLFHLFHRKQGKICL